MSHGLDLLRTPDGRWRLLAVSHGERESVEFFEVLDAGGAAPALAWRGCVLAAEGAAFNDVAALPDGGFLATDPSGDSWQRVRALLGVLGFNTGRVFRWHPQTGYSVVPNTATPYPNGIVLGPDGDSFYLNVYFDNEVRQQDLRSGEILGRAAVRQPDNSNWSPEGELLVASHRAPVRTLFRAVGAAPGERNRIPFAIVAVDPADMRTRELYLGDGAALGGGTAAVRVGGAIYVGAFRGDRLLKLLSPPR